MVLVKDDFLTEDELKRVWKEIDFLGDKLFPPSETGSAKDNDTKELLKKNKGVFIHRIMDVNYSSIQSILNKIVKKDFVDEAIKVHSIFTFLQLINNLSHLINYYDKDDFYKEHKDSAVLSGILFLYKEPKKFEGGELVFTETNQWITPKNNSFVLFPSYMKHEVKPIIMEEADTGYGRYSIASFLHINPFEQ